MADISRISVHVEDLSLLSNDIRSANNNVAYRYTTLLPRFNKIRIQSLPILGVKLHPLPIRNVEFIWCRNFGSCAGWDVSWVDERPVVCQPL